MGTLAVMNGKGDTKLIWSPDNAVETEAARTMFETLTRAGHHAFLVKDKGGKGERVTEFDPQAEKLILIPQLTGGQ